MAFKFSIAVITYLSLVVVNTYAASLPNRRLRTRGLTDTLSLLVEPNTIQFVTHLRGIAHKAGPEKWTVNITSRATYESFRRTVAAGALGTLIDGLTCKDADSSQDHFNRVKAEFKRRGLENQKFAVTVQSQTVESKTDVNGIARTTFEPSQQLKEGLLQFQGPLNSVGMLQVIGPDGFSIVSDIDDTIRITEVTKPLNALKNTFCKPFVPANGMPQLYSTLIKKLSTPSSPLQMHYVSGSPEELAVPLQNFISQHYTAGSMDLRRFAPSESDMWQGTQPHKLIAIDSLMEIFPQRKFVLIGDSGEQDPDTYAKIFNKWSPQNRTITCIFIRKVEGADNSEARFNKDFTGVPREKWVVFDDPKVVESADIANGKCA